MDPQNLYYSMMKQYIIEKFKYGKVLHQDNLRLVSEDCNVIFFESKNKFLLQVWFETSIKTILKEYRCNTIILSSNGKVLDGDEVLYKGEHFVSLMVDEDETYMEIPITGCSRNHRMIMVAINLEI